MSKNYLAIIPARGGSKRLPQKNLMKIGNDSLVGHAINCSRGLTNNLEICVSTDDIAIAEEAKQYGPYLHFMRPPELAQDDTRSIDVVKHAIHWFSSRGKTFDAFVLLQPTSPLRKREHVREALELFETRNAAGVVSVKPMDHPLQWCATLGEQGSMELFGAKLEEKVHPDCNQMHYQLNGAIYIFKIDARLNDKGFVYDDKTFAYVMDRWSSIDIDVEQDYMLAKAIWDIQSRSK